MLGYPGPPPSPPPVGPSGAPVTGATPGGEGLEKGLERPPPPPPPQTFFHPPLQRYRAANGGTVTDMIRNAPAVNVQLSQTHGLRTPA